jgi:hypothetical protein
MMDTVNAGGEVEVLGYKFKFAGWVGTDGPRGWRLEFDTEKPAQFLFDDGQVKDFSELVDRAHVTRLTAENARLQASEAKNIESADRHHHNWVEVCKERDALKAEVERLHNLHQVEQKRAGANAERANTLQSELTKALELLEDVLLEDRSSWDDKRLAPRIRTLLSNQSAPDAKDGE